jgi:hypothetical protein
LTSTIALIGAAHRRDSSAKSVIFDTTVSVGASWDADRETQFLPKATAAGRSADRHHVPGLTGFVPTYSGDTGVFNYTPTPTT